MHVGMQPHVERSYEYHSVQELNFTEHMLLILISMEPILHHVKVKENSFQDKTFSDLCPSAVDKQNLLKMVSYASDGFGQLTAIFIYTHCLGIVTVYYVMIFLLSLLLFCVNDQFLLISHTILASLIFFEHHPDLTVAFRSKRLRVKFVI